MTDQKTFDRISTYLRHYNYLLCLKEMHEMDFIDDICYKDRMCNVLKNEGFKCDEPFWQKGIN